MTDPMRTLRKLVSSGDTPDMDNALDEATSAIWDFVVQLIEERKRAMMADDLAGATRFRNQSYRELRHLLGVTDDPRYL